MKPSHPKMQCRELFDAYLPVYLNQTFLMAHRGFYSADHSFWVSLLEQNVNSNSVPSYAPWV